LKGAVFIHVAFMKTPSFGSPLSKPYGLPPDIPADRAISMDDGNVFAWIPA